MLIDVVMINPVIGDELLEQPIDQGEVGAGPGREVDLGGLGDWCQPRIHRYQVRRLRAGQSIEDPRPQHRLGCRHIVAEAEQGFSGVEVGVRAGLPIRAEGFL